jgi:trehalose-6-phosphatase
MRGDGRHRGGPVKTVERISVIGYVCEKGALSLPPPNDDIGSHTVFLGRESALVELKIRPNKVRAESTTLASSQKISGESDNAHAVISNADIASVGESKTDEAALHFRLPQDLQHRRQKTVEEIVKRRSGLRIRPRKMEMDAVRDRASNTDANSAFLCDRLFSGRIPIFAGDGPSDKVGFLAINARNGISIKVGYEFTTGRVRVDNALHFHDRPCGFIDDPRYKVAQ